MEIIEFKSTIKPLYEKELNFILSDTQIDKYFDFMNYLIEENQKINLTTIIEPIQIIYKHFLDSCQVIKFFHSYDPKKKFIDIGCGAGFPSIPLSILFDKSSFMLIDSVEKKLKFINRVVERIGLTNVNTVHSRIESLGHDIEFIEKYDCCLSRALSKIPTVLEYSSSVLRIHGNLFIYKLQDSLGELESSKIAQQELNLSYDKRIDYALLYSEPNRTIYSFVKNGKTPSKYPRKPGVPSKNPL